MLNVFFHEALKHLAFRILPFAGKTFRALSILSHFSTCLQSFSHHASRNFPRDKFPIAAEFEA